MGQVDPKFDFGFDTIAKGTYVLELKEASIEPEGTGKKSGKRYWARLAVIGGDQDGLTHIESFFEKTKDDFSFSKMAGFLYKLGVIKTLGKVNTDLFTTPDFENRWKNSMNGRKMGAKIRHRFADEDKNHETPRSDMEKYYSYDEVMAILNKGKAGPAVTGQPAVNETPAPAEKAPWD